MLRYLFSQGVHALADIAGQFSFGRKTEGYKEEAAGGGIEERGFGIVGGRELLQKAVPKEEGRSRAR